MFTSLKLGIDWGSAAPMAAVLGGQLAFDVRLSDDRVMPRGSWVIYDEHAEFDPRNIARGTGRSPSQIAPALHAMCARSGVRARGVIDAAAEAKTAGRHEDSISDLFRAGPGAVQPHAPASPLTRRGQRKPPGLTLFKTLWNRRLWIDEICLKIACIVNSCSEGRSDH